MEAKLQNVSNIPGNFSCSTSQYRIYFRDEEDKVETWTPNLKILGDNLPICQRGLRDVVIEVKGQESLKSTTTTTITATPTPEESKRLFEMSYQYTSKSSLKALRMFAKDTTYST